MAASSAQIPEAASFGRLSPECPIPPPLNTELEEGDGEGHIKEERERVKEEERQTDRLRASFPLTCSFGPQHWHPHIPKSLPVSCPQIPEQLEAHNTESAICQISDMFKKEEL
ncbi:unnamed protein product [Leuciscus chuanchicus]